MKNINAMIVDDSNFSVVIVKKLLEKNNITSIVVAKNCKEALELFKENDIQLVTMDITLPDGNGVELAHDLISTKPETIIIGISAMKDKELEMEIRNVGMVGLLQKPVQEGELQSFLDRIFKSEALYLELKDNYGKAFRDCFHAFVMMEIDKSAKFEYVEDEDFQRSRNISGYLINVGIIGRHVGRFLLDMDMETAEKLAKHSMGEEISEEDLIEFLGEFGNIVAGKASSMLNNINRALGLRVSPPALIRGENILVTTNDTPNSTSFKLKTKYGDIFMNVGFRRGVSEWMQA